MPIETEKEPEKGSRESEGGREPLLRAAFDEAVKPSKQDETGKPFLPEFSLSDEKKSVPEAGPSKEQVKLPEQSRSNEAASFPELKLQEDKPLTDYNNPSALNPHAQHWQVPLADKVVPPAESKPSMFQDIVSWAKSFKDDVATILKNPEVAAREMWEGIKYEAYNHPFKLAASVALGAAGAVAIGFIGTVAGTGAAIGAGVLGAGLLLYEGYNAVKEVGKDVRTLMDENSTARMQEEARNDLRAKGGSTAHLLAGMLGAGLAAGTLARWERQGIPALGPERTEWKYSARWGEYEVSKIRSWAELAAPLASTLPGGLYFPYINSMYSTLEQRYPQLKK